MILCRNGHPNEDGATYCVVCKVYIDSAVKQAEPEPIPEPPPVEVVPKIEPVAPVVSLLQTSLGATAGGEARGDVRVENPGAVAEDYAVEVTGAAAWGATVEPSTLRLQPRAVGTARLTFRLPQEQPAGAVPFEVIVRPASRPEESVVGQGIVQVSAATIENPVVAELRPPESGGRTSADHSLVLQNRSSQPLTAVVSAGDADGVLGFEIEPSSVSIPAGGTASAGIRVRAPKRVFHLLAKRREFHVLVVPENATALTVQGAFVHRRFVPLLLMPFAGLFSLLVTVIAALILIIVIWVILSNA